MKPLDLEAVQAFVLVADLKSFTRAAEILETTQSAVSLRLKRLEERLGRRLLERTPRLVRLSSDGAAFLDGARNLVAAHQAAMSAFTAETQRLVIGITHHLVGPDLASLLKRLGDRDPGLVIELRVASSRDVLADYDRGEIDAAIVLRHDHGRRDGEAISQERFVWLAAEDWTGMPGDVLRLATQPDPCSVRAMAIRALDQAGLPWTEVFIGGGVAALGAAVAAGLAVAALARRVAPPGTVDIGARLGLPALPETDAMLYSNVSDARSRAVLSTLAAAFRASAR